MVPHDVQTPLLQQVINLTFLKYSCVPGVSYSWWELTTLNSRQHLLLPKPLQQAPTYALCSTYYCCITNYPNTQQLKATTLICSRFCWSGIWKRHSKNTCLCSLRSGAQLGRCKGQWYLDNRKLKSSKTLFTHMSGTWAGRTQRLGLPTGAPTWSFSCVLASSQHGCLGGNGSRTCSAFYWLQTSQTLPRFQGGQLDFISWWNLWRFQKSMWDGSYCLQPYLKNIICPTRF